MERMVGPPTRRHGVVVSTLDFESRSPSSNLGGASTVFAITCTMLNSMSMIRLINFPDNLKDTFSMAKVI